MSNKNMSDRELIENACMRMGSKEFTSVDIVKLTNLDRKPISSQLSKLVKSGLLIRVKKATYKLVSDTVDPEKVKPVEPKMKKIAKNHLGKKQLPPNTVEVPPKYMLFHPTDEKFKWTVKDIEDAGFTLVSATIEGQGTIGKVPEYTTLPHDKYYTKDGNLYELEWKERRNITISRQTIKGEMWDDITSQIAIRRCHDFSIRMISMWIECSVEVDDDIITYKLLIEKYDGRFMISSMNGVSIHNPAFNLETLFRIIGDMFYRSCNWEDNVTGKKGAVCKTEIPEEYKCFYEDGIECTPEP